MNRAILADTTPLYASVDPSDAHHKRAQLELKRFMEEKRLVIVAYPTLLECHALVLKRLGGRAASAWLHDILTSGPPLDPLPKDYLEGVRKLESLPDQSITLFDATLAALAFRLKLRVWTYDHHFDLMRVNVWRR